MTMKKTLRELFETEKCVLAPEIYDCASAKAVEVCGYKATVLSGAEVSLAMLGIPDVGVLTFEEVLYATTRICDYSTLPMVVDCENGYGPALNVYHNCKRLAKAGAGGVIIVDCPNPRIGGVLPIEEAVEKYEAAHAALKGTDCLLVARTDATDLDEAILRCNRYREAGADITLVFMINNVPYNERYEACKKISEQVPGWKWYPDLATHDGKSDVSVQEIGELGFNFVGMHYLLGSAMCAMIDAGKQNFINENNVYSSDKYNYSGLGRPEDIQECMDFEKKFVKDPDLENKWPYSLLKRKGGF